MDRGKYVHFHIKNMNFQRSLYASGLKPFFRVGKEGKFKRITGKVTWNVSIKITRKYNKKSLYTKNDNTLLFKIKNKNYLNILLVLS